MEATKSSKPSMERVASGDSACRQAAALWMTTPLSAASSCQPSPKSEVYTIATCAWRRQARVWQNLASCRAQRASAAGKKNASPTRICHHYGKRSATPRQP